MARPDPRRIAPLAAGDLADHQLTQAGIDDVLRVLGRHPRLKEVAQPLGAFLLVEGELAPRLRELAILRVALRTGAAYMWTNHVIDALGLGLRRAEILALSDADAEWPAAEAAILRATDDLCTGDVITDPAWDELRAIADDQQIIELIFVVGFYRLMAGFLRSVGISVPDGSVALGDCPDPPG